MHDDELKARLTDAVDHRLSGMTGDPWLAQRIISAEKGAQPVVKRKLTVSLVLALAAMLLTLSVAAALVQSNILGTLYNSEADVPAEVVEQLHTPEATAAATLGVLTMDEWLYDGSNLHTSFTIENPTGEPLLYTLDGVWLNDKPLLFNRSNTDGAGTDGRILGGEADGTALPQSISFYHESGGVYLFDESDEYQGMDTLPEGEGTLKISVAVWKPLRNVELVDYDQYEGVDVTETRDHLTVDARGRSELALFRPASYRRDYTYAQLGSEVYADVYKELGWAELAEVITVETPVNLNSDDFAHAVPALVDYDQQDFALTITRFDLSHAGGEMEGLITGKAAVVEDMMKNGLCLVDQDGSRLLSGGCIWEDLSGNESGVHFTLELLPTTGDLPQQAILTPANTDGSAQSNSAYAVTIDLEINE